VADQSAVNAADELDRKTLTSLMMDLLHTLSQREATILTLRFGLDGGEERTLEEIGEKLGVTRERIRQLQNEALGKLRRQLRAREGWPLAA